MSFWTGLYVLGSKCFYYTCCIKNFRYNISLFKNRNFSLKLVLITNTHLGLSAMASAIPLSESQLLTELNLALDALNKAKSKKERSSFLLGVLYEKKSKLFQELEMARGAPAWVPPEPVYENGRRVLIDPSLNDLINFARGIPPRNPIEDIEEKITYTLDLISEITMVVQVAESVLATAQARYDTAKQVLEAPDH